jgi:hypothetical protein
MGEWRYGSTILHLGNTWRWAVNFTSRPLYSLGKITRYSLDKRLEACWASEPVWTLWSRENFLAPVGNRKPTVQHVVRCHSYWAIPALVQTSVQIFYNKVNKVSLHSYIYFTQTTFRLLPLPTSTGDLSLFSEKIVLVIFKPGGDGWNGIQDTLNIRLVL